LHTTIDRARPSHRISIGPRASSSPALPGETDFFASAKNQRGSGGKRRLSRHSIVPSSRSGDLGWRVSGVRMVGGLWNTTCEYASGAKRREPRNFPTFSSRETITTIEQKKG